MKLLIITWTLLLLASIFSIHAHPSKPLNERSTELAWQAWLLVDEHQNKQEGDGLLRRRITPKSIFITPTFSPDKLQPCADGYESDTMGRCMKIIKIDEDAHLEYLLQKLNAQFGVGMVIDVDEKLPTPGPIKFEISLGNGSPDTTEQVTEEPNGSGSVAIVVAPTNFIVLKHPLKDITTTLGSAATLQEEDTTILDEGSTSIDIEQGTATITSTKLPAETTLTQSIDSTTTDTSSTEFRDENTEPQALFFRDPSKTTLQPQPTIYDDVIVIGNRFRQPESTTYQEIDSTNTNTEAIRFDLSQSENKPNQEHIIKFPSMSNFFPSGTTYPPLQIYPTTLPPVSTSFKHQPDRLISDRVKDFEQLFSAYVNTRAGDLTANERLIFNRTDAEDSRQPPIVHHRPYNHRNRDKHHVAWQFPAPAEHYRRREPAQGTLDVRYTRDRQYPHRGEPGEVVPFEQQTGSGGQIRSDQFTRSGLGLFEQQGRGGSQRRTSTDRYYRPGAEGPAVYREVPRKDLSHIFGFKRALNNR